MTAAVPGSAVSQDAEPIQDRKAGMAIGIAPSEAPAIDGVPNEDIWRTAPLVEHGRAGLFIVFNSVEGIQDLDGNLSHAFIVKYTHQINLLGG